MEQLFNETLTIGKVISSMELSYCDALKIVFTDDTYIVIEAYATDGWRGEANMEVAISHIPPGSAALLGNKKGK